MREAWENVLAGRSGIARITRFDPSRLAKPDRGRGEGLRRHAVHSGEGRAPHDLLHPLRHRHGLQAWRDSGLSATPENAERIGVNFGSGIGGLPMMDSTTS
ncbi:MAG: beta-ketoacyl synthase N-terminal-like domain-containing protein [Burkholderiales bacterium]|nr:beta-ketoacyl synthase N-terminal-like domain-containing protein [Burkholderiales bacterium]